MPGLPLYGTVSAATPLIPAEKNSGMGSKLSSAAMRVSQVINTMFYTKKKKSINLQINLIKHNLVTLNNKWFSI